MEWQTLARVSPALADSRAALQRAAHALGSAPLEWDAGRAALIGQAATAGERPVLPVADPELAGWYADADLLLREVAAREPDLGPIQVWPPDLDIAAVLRFEGGPPREGERQIRL